MLVWGNTMSANWYALHVKPHKERSVCRLLDSPERLSALMLSAEVAESLSVFFPSVRVKPVNPRSAKVRPFFPGYVFVHADLELVGVSALNRVPGANGLVSFGDTPAIVPPALIVELKQRMVQIEQAGGLVFDDLKPGDPVRIIDGPFAGYEAVFDMRLPDSERVQVLLAFLSDYPQRLKIEQSKIAPVKKPPAPGRDR